MNIAALCVREDSIYKSLGLDCYDINRNARTYVGRSPVIAHPPCRGWSASMYKLARPRPGERDLAYFCAERVACNGGVLEHPAYSRFLRNFKGSRKFHIEQVDQIWFGHKFRKRTWLLMPRGYDIPELPFRLVTYGGSVKQWANLPKKLREETPIEFAKWLIKLIEMNHEI